jgi:hypothetical protein
MRIQINDGNNSRSELEGRDELPHKEWYPKST